MRILWVKTELLHPIDKGGRIRTYQMLRALLRDHRITYLCLDDGTSPQEARRSAQEYCSELITVPFRATAKGTLAYALHLMANLLSPLPYAISRYRSEALQARVVQLASTVDLIICDFLAPSQNIPRRLPVPVALFQHNVEAIIWQRRASVVHGALQRAYLRAQWRRMRRLEAAECRRFDRVIAVSEADAEAMRTKYAAPSVASIPTGVDVDYFSPALSSPGETRHPRELLFVGSMDWMPNEDGICWFIQEVFGLVRQRVPEVTLTVVGRAPSRAIHRLADQMPGISVTGTVPDVRPYLRRAAVSIVPLRVGGGTRIKIYEAMAAGVPVVSTSIGAEGLPVMSGEHLLLGDTPGALAGAIVTLLDDPAHAQRIADHALRFVRTHCSWEAVAAVFLSHCTAPHSPQPAREDAIA